MAEVVMNPDWEGIVNRAAYPIMEGFARDIKRHIDDPPGPIGSASGGAPVQTGHLRDASQAEVEPDSDVLVGVEEGVPYADQVIQGTSTTYANDYIGRATDFALQDLRVAQHHV